MPGGAVEHSGDLLTGPIRAQGQMPGAFLDVLGCGGQPLVYLPAFIQPHLGIQARLQEGMGEPQDVPIAFDEASVDGTVDSRPGLAVIKCRADEPLTRVGGGSDQLAHPSHLGRQLAHAAPHEITEAVGDGEGLVGKGQVRAVQECSGAFEGVERVPAARVIQPGKGVPGQHSPQPGPQDLADRAQAQRVQPDTAEPIRRQGAVQAERDRVVGTEGQQDEDRLVSQAAAAELQHACGRAVQPLRVVNGHHERRARGKDPQGVQDCSRQHPRVRHRMTGLGKISRQGRRGRIGQRSRPGLPARPRKRRKDLPGDVTEQVIKRREGERSFGRRRPARQYPG